MRQSGKVAMARSRAHKDQRRECGIDDGLIYDVGAHSGEDTSFYLGLGYRVVAIEANPQLAAKLRSDFADALADGRLIVVEQAVSTSRRTVDFFINEKKSDWGTANADWAARNERVGAPSRRISVSAIPFGEILREFGIPYYLKVDIEGSDRLCIMALEKFAARPKFVSIEASVGKWSKLAGEFEMLERLGYKSFQIVRQGRHQSRTFLSRCGECVAFSFNIDSSGPFGEHLEGRWLSSRQALRRYRWIWLLERLLSDDSPIGRLLAKVPVLARIPAALGWYDTHAMR